MKYLIGLFLISQFTLNLFSQQVIYKNDDFYILKDRVKQGIYESVAQTDKELVTTYKSSFKTPTKNHLEIKFSINGLDNERDFARNHNLSINPVNGKATSPIIVFGQDDPPAASTEIKEGFLAEDVDYLVRLDMRKVLNDFNTLGYFTTFNGQKIRKDDFKGVYIAGNTYPLTWDFESLSKNGAAALTDNNNDGIFEVTIHFKKEYSPVNNSGEGYWRLLKNTTGLPQLESPHRIVNALYNKALEEMLFDVRDDGAFMAGEKWPGVWTRDISYSIYLSLAIVNPDACKTSLMAKVKNKRIIQDTGTGGSWPVSSDRMVWALAAWEVYVVTGDKEWLKQSFEIIENSANDDLKTVRSYTNGLFNGESSFLDWREQTYPKWADPVDIYKSQCLGTNAVHYQAFVILSQMAKELNKPTEKYQVISETVKEEINKRFWMNDKGYYGQYLYGRTYPALSSKSEALGEALAVIFDITNREQQKSVISNTPVINFGTPTIFPNIPNISSYHNNSVWPFVEAFWALAAAKAGNATAVEHALASIYRSSALFLTNKENFVAQTGDYFGTEINSDRQLWSVAGCLSTVYRVLFGMNFEPKYLELDPFIPAGYEGVRTLRNFKYRDAVLDITVEGFGNSVDNIMLDGKMQPEGKISAALKGIHSVKVIMKNKIENPGKINLVQNSSAPEMPVVKLDKQTLNWEKIDGAEKYIVYENGRKIAETPEAFYVIGKNKDFTEYQVLAENKEGFQSFLSEPFVLNSDPNTTIFQAELKSKQTSNTFQGYTGSGYVHLNKGDKNDLNFEIDIKTTGSYRIDFRYANGNGPVNTDNKCAIRTLMLDKKALGPVVMPHKGEPGWTNWGFSNSLVVNLKKGKHNLILTFRDSDNNMNYEINSALIDYMRLTAIK